MTTTALTPPSLDAKGAYVQRVAQLQSVLREMQLDGAVLMKPRNMYYYSNFNAVIYSRAQFVLVPTVGRPVLIMPKLRASRARTIATIDEIRTYHEFDPNPEDRYANTVLARTVTDLLPATPRLGIEAEFVPVSVHRALMELLPNASTTDIGAILQSERMHKDELELFNQIKAADIAAAGMARANEIIQQGGTEIDVNVGTETALMEAWSAKYSDDAIVGFGDDEDGVASAEWCWTQGGPRFAISLPGYTHEPIPEGEALIVIIWTTVNGYGVEYERTIFKGTPSEERRRAYEAMMSAREAVRAAIRPGAVGDALVTVASEAIQSAGYPLGPGFVGHGIGLGHHEQPHLLPGSDVVLEPGMVLAIEPGMVFEDYGVRHSDTVVVEADGCRSLTPWDLFTALS